MRFPSLFACLLLMPCFADAATYYASPTGSGSTCTTSARCTLTTGLGLMSAGDTLILGDGTYDQAISLDSSGSAGNYRTIKAEHDGLAILTSSTASWDPVVRIQGSYWQVEGLKVVANANSGVMRNTLGVYNGANYNKILRCAFVSTPCTSASTCADQGNVDLSGSYNLIEDSWAWGGGRYKFTIFGGDGASYGNHNILRRVVVRHDRQAAVNPQAGICLYQGGYNIVQNALVIDSDQLSYYTGNDTNNWQGAYFIEKGSQHNPNMIKGSMAINFGKGNSNHPAMAIYDDHQAAYDPGAIYVSDFFAFNGAAGFGQTGFPLTYPREIDHSAILNTDGSGADWGTPSMGPGFGMATSSLAKATNTIFNGITGDPALYGAGGANNYNSFYGNTTNRTNSTTGANDITNVNPLAASLLYPVRVESGSPLKGAGAGGTDIGPTILKRIGVSGTLYGETGYDTVTSDNLWPWPNESRIKADMSEYPSNWPADGLPNPVRGFTAGNSLDGSSQTLTKYVWETLGTQIPSDVYGVATGCTYYVRPDGHDAASGTNNTADASTGAWLTIPTSTSSSVTHPLAAGDVVCVEDGNYTGFHLRAGGTSDNPVIIKALGTGANITAGNDRTDGITLEGYGSPAYSNYVTIDGFNVYGRARHGIYVANSTGVIVQKCTVHDNAQMGILTGNAPNFSAIGNTLYANGSNALQHNLYISNSADNPIVRGNIIRNSNFGNGLQLNGDYETDPYEGYIDNALIENNIIYSNAQKGMSLISVRNSIIRNNIIYSNGSSAGGIHLVDQLGSHFSSGNTVVNNTLDEPIIACVRINDGSTGNVVFNNICIGSTGIVFEGTGNYQSNNYSAATGGASIFTSYSGHNYTMLSTSPAKDFGIASYQSKSAPATDYLGNVRSSGGGYDAGAYEYQDALPSGGPTWLTSGGSVLTSGGAVITPAQ